ncbi:MAG TPA: polymer-forming cytoskeletal protein [Acidimicrobiia bacterium]|nr:polymer-forming cytoskeletal protein [Acidimicrobiia bacterium]
MRCRVLVAAAIACFFLVGTAHAAGAQDGGDQEHGRRISVTGGLVVASGEVVSGPAVSANGPVRINGRVNGAVYVGRGDLRIDGRVTGDVLVLDGDALITGRVGGSVTVLSGKATVRSGAVVQGDVASRTAPTAARGTVQGHVAKLDINSLFAGFVVVILVVLWIAVTLSTALLGLFFVWLFPCAADAVVVAGRRVWSSFFLGLFVGILAFILGLAIMASVVGIPLGFAVLGTLAVLVPLGYVGSALIFGRLMVHGGGTGGRLGAFFAGFGILRFGALVPGLGFVIGFFFATYGFGALIIAAWRAGRRAFRVEDWQPEYAAVPPSRYGEEAWPPYVPIPEPRRRAAPRTTSRARAARARKTGARKAPAKKKTTRARKAPATKRSTTRAKAPPRKRPTKTARKPAKRTAKKSAKRTTKRTTKTTARKPAKKTAKRTTKKAGKRSTTKRRSTTTRLNGRTTVRKRVSANNSRTTRRPRPRKASTNRSGARARA